MSIEEQYAKIEEARDSRSIERPAVAQRRRKKESKTSDKKKDKARDLLMNLTSEEKAELIAKLKK
jgi:hypothetical protein